MHTFDPELTHHAFLADLTRYQLEQVARCATPVTFLAGQFIFHEGDEANCMYLLTEGRVAVEIGVPDRRPITVQILGAGDVLGWSWFRPPYRWHFDAETLDLTRGVAFDSHCLRQHCETDHSLGFALTKQYGQILFERLQATRMQLVEAYTGH